MREYFSCPRHGGVFAMEDYRQHMDDQHDGRHDCVLGLTGEQAFRVSQGIPASHIMWVYEQDPMVLFGLLLQWVADMVTRDWRDWDGKPFSAAMVSASMLSIARSNRLHPEFTPERPRMFGAWSF